LVQLADQFDQTRIRTNNQLSDENLQRRYRALVQQPLLWQANRLLLASNLSTRKVASPRKQLPRLKSYDRLLFSKDIAYTVYSMLPGPLVFLQGHQAAE